MRMTPTATATATATTCQQHIHPGRSQRATRTGRDQISRSGLPHSDYVYVMYNLRIVFRFLQILASRMIIFILSVGGGGTDGYPTESCLDSATMFVLTPKAYPTCLFFKFIY